METLYLIVAGLLVAFGLIGTLVPILPGLLFVFLGLCLWAWAKHFQTIPTDTIGVLAVLTVAGFALDFLAGALGAKLGGANKQAVWGSIFGGVIGIFLGPLGLILGPMVGAVIGQMMYTPTHLNKATKVALATLLGLVLGTFAKLLIGLTMVVAAWRGWTF